MITGSYDRSGKLSASAPELNASDGSRAEAANVVLPDWIAAICLTGLGAFIAWYLAGGLPAIGIDDAAITRSYSENIANGLGYVYNAGGERVEGSTSFLWTMLLALLYALTSAPEVPILLLTGALSAAAVFCALRIARRLAGRTGAPASLTVAVQCVALIASPGYFLWSVWTMMELALWSCMTLMMVWQLVRAVEAEGDAGAPGLWLFLPALALPLSRPEGIAVAAGLLCLAAVICRRWRRSLLLALVLALVSFAAVTLFRLAYFGQPFPNTFYAKVSSDRIQDITDGAKYAISYALGAPFVAVFLAAWAAAVIWAVPRALRGQPGSRGLLIVAAAIAGFLAVYACLGGDHFVLWRFYQPVTPLLPVALGIGLSPWLGALSGGASVSWARWAVPALAAAAACALLGWMHYYQARFDVAKEFTLNGAGIDFGNYLDTVSPRPSIGIGPAGGIALAYDGYIYDLLGLNWVEMAHANPVKTGMRNHASFDEPTFWKHAPDVLAMFERGCAEGREGRTLVVPTEAYDGMLASSRFRDHYRPVLFQDPARCWPGFATPAWLAQVAEDPGITPLAWSDVDGKG